MAGRRSSNAARKPKDLKFALSIQLKGRHARDEFPVTYSFYPLYRTDLPEVVKMMAAYTEKFPLDEMGRVKEILVGERGWEWERRVERRT